MNLTLIEIERLILKIKFWYYKRKFFIFFIQIIVLNKIIFF
jgi:hypothetical protein